MKKEFNPLDCLERLITDPNDPGYVNLKDLDISAIVGKYQITTFHHRKKIMEKVQKRYDRAVAAKRLQSEMQREIDKIRNRVVDLERQSDV